MRPCFLLLTVLMVLVGCKPEDAPTALRLVRTLVVDPKSIGEDRRAIGEVKPRYESDLSFRVAGKVLSRLVDVGAWVKQGDTLATLDTQDYQNRLRSAEADVSSGNGELVWKFTKRGKFEFACLIPGHYEKGMFGKVVVK
jgi:multidrug efflux pump subunit AcrA (membrane-fusion protein)